MTNNSTTPLEWPDLEPGRSYACEFWVETMLTTQGTPPTQDTDEIDTVGTYTSIGVVRTRDTKNQLATVQDTRTLRDFVVPWSSTRNLDTVEWRTLDN